ncbi:hypothetical protein SDC9_88768 [bioreactor metagenome]|uniref:Uncharacterized protein n=1 Tax=bioreactor metagenome TaxID=1076179 RepID=A0A644ZMW5_9ZZZZ
MMLERLSLLLYLTMQPNLFDQLNTLIYKLLHHHQYLYFESIGREVIYLPMFVLQLEKKE